MLSRRPRWTWLLVLPVLVGALLMMHGLGARAGAAHHAGASSSAVVVEAHPHHESTPEDHGHCVDCLAGHVMAACVAVIAAAGGLGLIHLLVSRGRLVAPVDAVAGRIRGLVDLARPPDPAWVRLSVMHC